MYKLIEAMQNLRQHAIFIVLIVLLALAGGAGAWFAVSRAAPYPQENVDVVVVGAGPGGIAAAIQAARLGAHVALLEQTDWLGGQITAAAVGSMDEGSTKPRGYGIYGEFAGQVSAFYAARNTSASTCYYGTDSLCVDPQTAQTILRGMLQREASHLQLYTAMAVSDVTKRGTTVTGVIANGKQFNAKVVIDADEYGDLLAKAGAAYRLGNETSENLKNTSSACVQDITYAAIMKQYAEGPPTSLRFDKAPPGYTPAIAKHFAGTLKHDGYDHVASHGRSPMDFPSYIAYRGLPDPAAASTSSALQYDGHPITRTALNLGNDYPLAGNLSIRFIDDPAYRAQAICQAKLLTLQLAYYIQHDLGEHDWSLADDEGYDTPYNRQQHCAILAGFEAFENQMPPEPYVREARRLVGAETLTGNELAAAWQTPKNTPHYSDSIAVGYYPMDLHQCRQASSLEPQFDATSDISAKYAGGAFEVPMGALIPEHTDGLLAAEKNISASRQAAGAIREQPIAMDIGQAVGALAALAVRQHIQPRQVGARAVQTVLHSEHIPTHAL
jgi:hypothetical protein